MTDEILPEQIDGAFVPQPHPDVVSIELDGEIVLTAPGPAAQSERSHLLDTTASIVWQCLDGTTPIGVLADDVAVVVDGDPHVIREDLITLFVTLGRAGVLAGVRAADRPS